MDSFIDDYIIFGYVILWKSFKNIEECEKSLLLLKNSCKDMLFVLVFS